MIYFIFRPTQECVSKHANLKKTALKTFWDEAILRTLTRKAGLRVTNLKGNVLLGGRQEKREEPLHGGLTLRKSWNGCEILAALHQKIKPHTQVSESKVPKCGANEVLFPSSLAELPGRTSSA